MHTKECKEVWLSTVGSKCWTQSDHVTQPSQPRCVPQLQTHPRATVCTQVFTAVPFLTAKEWK